MSTHPNVILIAVLTPDDLARRTYRAIMEKYTSPEDLDPQIKIGEGEYRCKVMEEDYDEDMQISAPEGSIVLYELVTYGYGEKVAWEKLDKMRADLKEWLDEACLQYACKAEIFVSANYW